MFMHSQGLQYTVRVSEPNPVLGKEVTIANPFLSDMNCSWCMHAATVSFPERS
jgi:hypothetical protein